MDNKEIVKRFGAAKTRARFNEQLARQIEAYWLGRGYQVEARVGPDAEIESSTLNGLPHKRQLPPRKAMHYLKHTTSGELEQIKNDVCEFHHVERSELESYDRRAHVAMARHDLCYRLFMRGDSYSDVGRALSLDHSTVLYAVRKWKKVGRNFSL
jgi:hypothetical protein